MFKSLQLKPAADDAFFLTRLLACSPLLAILLVDVLEMYSLLATLLARLLDFRNRSGVIRFLT